MAFETKELSGALFKNKRKERDTHPDYTGTCKIDGEEFWISAWLNKPKGNPNGETYMSLQFKVKEDRPQPARPANGSNFEDEDISF